MLSKNENEIYEMSFVDNKKNNKFFSSKMCQ